MGRAERGCGCIIAVFGFLIIALISGVLALTGRPRIVTVIPNFSTVLSVIAFLSSIASIASLVMAIQDRLKK